MIKVFINKDRMRLRPIEERDHEWLVELHNDPVVLRNLTHPEPIDMGKHLNWWAKTSKDVNQVRMIFEVDDDRVGLAKLIDIDAANQNCVLGADIHEAFRGRGYAKHLWGLMLDRCFDNLNLHRVSLTTAEFNEVGQRVYRALGFKEEGRLTQSLFRDGRYWDQIMMYLLRDDWVSNDVK